MPFSLPRLSFHWVFGLMLAVGLIAAPAQARQDQSPPPADRPADLAEARPLQRLAAIRQALADMELEPEQREKVDAAFENVLTALAQAGRDSGGDPQATARAAAPVLQQLREVIDATLTDTQRLQLRRRVELAMAQSEAPRPAPPPSMPGVMDDEPRMAEEQRPREPSMDGMAAAPNASPQAATTREAGGAFLQRLTSGPGLPVGEALPQTVTVVTLEGRERPLRHYLPRSRCLVVLLGSTSSPVFRHRMAELVDLQRQVGRDADVLIIYTREHHAAGEWEIDRNAADGVAIPQHTTLDERIAAARNLRVAMRIRPELLADAMDDNALLTLVGDIPHSAALVFGPDGTLLARQQWLDPSGLPALVPERRRQ